jgi:hypothetical protein
VQLAALIVAVIAVCLSVFSLSWQLVSFVLSGPRIRVQLDQAFRDPVQGAMLVTTPEAIVGGLGKLRELGYLEHVVLVRVANTGRTAATVERWNIRFGNGALYLHPASDPVNLRVPARLEPHSSVTWHTPVEWLQGYQAAFTQQTRRAKRIRAVIGVAGREGDLTSRWAYRVDAAGLHRHGRFVRRVLGSWWRRLRSKMS